jgi:nucleoside-diphosphate-sugar epimerase
MKFTLFGSHGFIGRHFLQFLREQGAEVYTPGRRERVSRGGNLGHVIYAIGLTGNFRKEPRATIDAHVNVIQQMLEQAEFESWLYLSSTRVYGNIPLDVVAHENLPIPVQPSADALYDLSKLLGESLCMREEVRTVRVARLSNVYGADQNPETFLGSVFAHLAEHRRVLFHEAPASAKDYIAIEDVVRILYQIATAGKHRLYNVASGVSVSHEMLAAGIAACGQSVEFSPDAPVRAFPMIGTNRITSEFGGVSHALLTDLPTLLQRSRDFHINMLKENRRDTSCY